MTFGKLLGSAQTNCLSGQRTDTYLGIVCGQLKGEKKVEYPGWGYEHVYLKSQSRYLPTTEMWSSADRTPHEGGSKKDVPICTYHQISRPLPPFVFPSHSFHSNFPVSQVPNSSLWLLCLFSSLQSDIIFSNFSILFKPMTMYQIENGVTGMNKTWSEKVLHQSRRKENHE